MTHLFCIFLYCVSSFVDDYRQTNSMAGYTIKWAWNSYKSKVKLFSQISPIFFSTRLKNYCLVGPGRSDHAKLPVVFPGNCCVKSRSTCLAHLLGETRMRAVELNLKLKRADNTIARSLSLFLSKWNINIAKSVFFSHDHTIMTRICDFN